MSIQYYDVVFQCVDRLNLVIGASSGLSAKLKVMPFKSFQGDIADFMKGAGGEKARMMVTHSGIQAEGGREAWDFMKAMGGQRQEIGHGVEIHICTKEVMKLTTSDPNNITTLYLTWLAAEALRGLHMYARKSDGSVDLNNPDSIRTNGVGLFHIETLIDRDYNGSLFSTVRMQVMETVFQMDTMSPEQVWSTFQQFTLEEYSGAAGGDKIVTTGSPDNVVVVPET
jgi:hypothetical protein